MPTFLVHLPILRVLLAALLLISFPAVSDAQRQSPQRAASPPRPERIAVEDVASAIRRQAALLDESIAQLAPSDPAGPSVYFLGFSSFAPADVFLREIAGARRVAEEHLGARGRSLLLINHRDTLDDVPLATPAMLDQALMRLGRVMNVEKDVLVLFLTSHGLPGEIAVWFPGFTLDPVTPTTLAASLARSGIKNKVVILSACYSGSFIPALAARDTLVMTAARADRTSFGCNPRNAWTWFGDALFNRALRQTASLPEAFEAARAMVGQWKREQRMQPSEPQILVGEAIRPRLEQLARRLEAPAVRVSN